MVPGRGLSPRRPRPSRLRVPGNPSPTSLVSMTPGCRALTVGPARAQWNSRCRSAPGHSSRVVQPADASEERVPDSLRETASRACHQAAPAWSWRRWHCDKDLQRIEPLRDWQLQVCGRSSWSRDLLSPCGIYAEADTCLSSSPAALARVRVGPRRITFAPDRGSWRAVSLSIGSVAPMTRTAFPGDFLSVLALGGRRKMYGTSSFSSTTRMGCQPQGPHAVPEARALSYAPNMTLPSKIVISTPTVPISSGGRENISLSSTIMSASLPLSMLPLTSSS